jgi:UDP-2-acetamido-2,6-beta-L-arabino-hexul-4-ose reductase
MLYKWACESGSPFTGMIIPNVFWPFGNPYYNSVVATFSYQLTHNETPKIDTDALLKMIYVDDLAEAVFNIIKNRVSNDELRVKHTTEISVKEILSLLASFQSLYVEKGIIPDIRNRFERDLFNTFVTYLDIETHFPVKLNQSIDSRGSFVETAKITSGGQISFSTTKPGITRGNHFHTRKAERFAVIKGKALIQLRRIGNDKVISFELDGSLPAYVDMPIWYTHNITNIGDNELFTIFWISEFFDPKDPDTYFETV